MANYLSVDDWKAQLKKNKLLSGTGISEALRKFTDARKDGTALEFGNAVNALIATANKAQKKFLADKASVAYMQEIVKAANVVMGKEVNVRAGEEMAGGLVDVLDKLVDAAKTATALGALQQKTRAASAAVGKVAKLSGLSGKFGDISKDDWFSTIDDNTFVAKKKEIAKVIDDIQKALA